MTNALELALAARELARRQRCNLPQSADPERFHVEKDAIAVELEELAGKIERHFGPGPTPARERIQTGLRAVSGRLVPVVPRHRAGACPVKAAADAHFKRV